ncbi:MAG: hypothetical protein QM783_02340 [Phycisphaerales bacterium]
MSTPRCHQCRYDMAGLPLVRCPECGGSVFLIERRPPTPLELACWAMPVIVCVLMGFQLVCTRVPMSWGCDGFDGNLLSLSLQYHSNLPKPIFKAASFVVVIAPLVAALLTACMPRRRSLALSAVAMLLGQLGVIALCLRWTHGDEGPLSGSSLGVLACGAVAAASVWCVALSTPTLRS